MNIGVFLAVVFNLLFWGWIGWLLWKPVRDGYRKGVKIAENENQSGFAKGFESDILDDTK